MSSLPFYVKLAELLPVIERPQKRLTLRDKLKYTAFVLILFYALGCVTVFGINKAGVAQLELYEILFGSRMGSIITLGIGPIVMASIVLQMFVGSKMIPWDLRKEEDKAKFTAAQKLLTIFFCFFEATSYVLSGWVPASSATLVPVVILQLALGGILIMYLDEICMKWGIGSGVSLFIAAGVSRTIFQHIFLPPIQTPRGPVSGILASFILTLFEGDVVQSLLVLLPLVSTVIVFAIVLFTQGIRVEIPISFSLPFGKLPTRRWPLRFFYTSNIPVILTAALLMNIRAFAHMLSVKGIYILGRFEGNTPVSGLAYFLTPPSPDESVFLAAGVILAMSAGMLAGLLASKKFKKYVLRSAAFSAMLVFIAYAIFLAFAYPDGFHQIQEYALPSLTYLLAMVIGSTIFSIFWVNTAGMDPKSVAEQFKSAYLSVPGFRRDPRIIERLLEKYIPALTVLGGAFVGFLAGIADLTAALGTGTGILLTAIILMQFYESVAAQHLEDIHPGIRKFIGR